MGNKMIVITEKQVEELSACICQNELSYFGYNIDKEGTYFCDPNTQLDFPEYFKDQIIEYKEINFEDVFDDEGENIFLKKANNKSVLTVIKDFFVSLFK